MISLSLSLLSWLFIACSRCSFGCFLQPFPSLSEYHYVDLTRPIIDVTEWRGASPASSVNVQNSGSSITNDIHSSLHSQKEDKLVCSQELPSEKILSHVDGLLTSKTQLPFCLPLSFVSVLGLPALSLNISLYTV